MALLSNNSEGVDQGLTCRPARATEQRLALGMILGAAGRPASASQVGEFLHFARQRKIDLARLEIAEQAGKMLWAALPVTSPGRTMLLFCPTWFPGGDISPARMLINEVCQSYAADGMHLAQVLLETSEQAMCDFLAMCGFSKLAELIYLQTLVHRASAPPKWPDGFTLEPYSAANHDLFRSTITESYRESLDCPALSGLREVDDVIAGHQATGEFDPAMWYLLQEHDVPLGVLLLSRIPRSDSAELVYLGLCPEARGRGLGDLLMRKALHTTATVRLRRLTLAVDAINLPALKCYYRHGMQRLTAKIAMIRSLRSHRA